MKYEISVYLANDRVFKYDIERPAQFKAREHAVGIAHFGYVHNDGNGGLEIFPAHQIYRVTVQPPDRTERP